MKKIKLIFLLVLAVNSALLLGQIKNEAFSEQRINLCDTIHVPAIDNGLCFNDVFNISKIIKLETSNGIYIGKIRSCYIVNGEIIVFDSYHNGYVFNGRGDHKKSIEVSKMSELKLKKITSSGINPYSNRVFFVPLDEPSVFLYNLDGKLDETIQLPWKGTHHAFVEENVLAVLSGWWDNSYKGRMVDDYLFVSNGGDLHYSGLEDYPLKRSGVINTKRFSYFHDSLRLILNGSNNVFSVNKDSFHNRYFLDFKESNLPKCFFDSLKFRDYTKALFSSEYVGWINHFFESDAFLTFSYIKGREVFWCIYNKHLKASKSFHERQLINNGYLDNKIDMRGIHGNDFLIIVHPQVLLEKINRKGLDFYDLSQDSKSLLSGLKETDNPLILVCNLK